MPRMHRPAHARDLFGDVPVTVSDLEAWTLAVAGIAPGTPRWETYVRTWNVADKVRQAKLAGDFERITSAAAVCARCQSAARSGR